MRTKTHILIPLVLGGVVTFPTGAVAQSEPSDTQATAPTSSIMAKALADPPVVADDGEPHALRDGSMFAIAPVKPRAFHKHDLIQIVVRETSKAESSQELDSKKDYKLDGKITAFPSLTLEHLLDLQIGAGRTSNLPAVKVGVKKDFKGEGDYKREDDFTARLSAEVIEVLPNGQLILEARTAIKTDQEEATMKVTGRCRPVDVTAANTILSSQIHDLKIEKMHKGELKKANEKGLIAKILDTIFAF